jgi:hypothetical protein
MPSVNANVCHLVLLRRRVQWEIPFACAKLLAELGAGIDRGILHSDLGIFNMGPGRFISLTHPTL